MTIVVQPVKTVKELVTKGLEGETYWKQSGEMKTERSFFCAVDLMDSAFMTIGGYSSNNKIINQTEYFVISRNWTRRYKQPSYQGVGRLAEMIKSRSGHSCTLLTSDRSKVLVSGEKIFES